MSIKLQITEDELPAFITFLGIGILSAIRDKAVPSEVGIWTVGRPLIWEFLVEQPQVPKDVIKVFRMADELSAIEKLLPNEFDAKVQELINQLETELAKIKDPTWQIRWLEDEPARAKALRKRQTSVKKRMSKSKRRGIDS